MPTRMYTTVSGKMTGKGTMTYANKDVYVDEWTKGLKEGSGVVTYHNGDEYTGRFRYDTMHGRGTFEYAAGDYVKVTGEWKEGKKQSGKFEGIPRARMVSLDFENDETKTDQNVKRESPYDNDTDTEDFRPSKHRNVSVSP